MATNSPLGTSDPPDLFPAHKERKSGRKVRTKETEEGKER